METGNLIKETSLSKGMKVLWGLMIFQTLGVVISLLLFPAQAELFFFWKISPPINALLLGYALYIHGDLRRAGSSARTLGNSPLPCADANVLIHHVDHRHLGTY